MKDGKVKYTVTFPAKISELIDDISDKECISKPEVLRRAIALYSYIHKEVESNKKVCLIDRDDETRITEVVFQ